MERIVPTLLQLISTNPVAGMALIVSLALVLVGVVIMAYVAIRTVIESRLERRREHLKREARRSRVP